MQGQTITYTAYKQDNLEYVELNNYEKKQEEFVTTLIEHGCSAVEAYYSGRNKEVPLWYLFSFHISIEKIKEEDKKHEKKGNFAWIQ